MNRDNATKILADWCTSNDCDNCLLMKLGCNWKACSGELLHKIAIIIEATALVLDDKISIERKE